MGTGTLSTHLAADSMTPTTSTPMKCAALAEPANTSAPTPRPPTHGEMVATGMSATKTGADGMTMMTSRHPTCAALAQPQPPPALPWLATTATPTTTTPPVTHGVTIANGTPETRDSAAS